jgi:hypothetical protein
MLTFTQLLEELAQKEITLYAAEVQRMKDRFGDKTLQMGHLQEDGSGSTANVARARNVPFALLRTFGR